MSKVIKDEIVKTLTGKLSEIADAIIKEVKEKAPDIPVVPPVVVPPVVVPPVVVPPVVPPVEKPAVPAEDKSKGDEVLTKSVADLATKIEELTKKFNVTPTSEETEELTKKQGDKIKIGMLELIKTMGIDTENVDVDFTVKEKKKGTIVAKSEKFDKVDDDNEDDDNEELLNKELSELEPEQKKEALDHYFKALIFPKKS